MGNRIGPYEVLKELGRGGTSTCYLVIKPPLERKILLKVLYPHFAQDTEILTRFEREARVMSRLHHPNILQVLDFGKLESTYFITMEFIEGKLLDQLLIEKEIEKDDAVSIILGVLNALSYVHARGIIHRDIKPSNILITMEGTPKLTDFGIAWCKSMPGITMDGTFLGTPAYMSPEQIRGEKLDNRTDIYSVGLVFLELITGIKSYPGTNYSKVIQNVLTKLPQGTDKLESKAPAELTRIIKKMIEKEYSSRYGSVDDIIYEIKQFRGEIVHKKKLTKTTFFLVWSMTIAVLGVIGWSAKKFYGLREIKLSEGGTSEISTMDTSVNITHELPIQIPDKNKTTTPEMKSISHEAISQYPLYISVLPYAKIYLNDTFIGETPPPLQTSVKTGKHTLTLKHPYLPSIIRHINMEKDKELNINLFDEVSYLSIIVKPWAEIWVDGTHYGTTPLAEPLTLLPGLHEIKMRNPYYQEHVDTVNLVKGDTFQIRFEFKK